MGSKPNIYLIGLSGTGKTRSGRRLAEILKWPFVEMDGIIEDRTGKSIPRIFDENGEKAIHKQPLATDKALAQKDGYRFFMEKEIYEQSTVISDTMMGRVSGDTIHFDELSEDFFDTN